jgi:hypothetical protein
LAKCREIFLSLLGPNRKAYPTQISGDIHNSSRPHSESLSNTNVGRYSYLFSVPFGKPIQHECREIFLPFLSPIRKAYPTKMSGDILASPRSHPESLPSKHVTLTCHVIMWEKFTKCLNSQIDVYDKTTVELCYQ